MRAFELTVPPVAQVIIAALAMWAISFAFPAAGIHIPIRIWAATAFGLSGVAVALLAVTEFRRASTTVDPRTPREATSLVVGGVYRLSRNPMYLGLLLMLIAWAVYLANGLACVMPPLFVVYMNRFQIVPEERHLLAKFGAVYRSYTARVRRWL